MRSLLGLDVQFVQFADHMCTAVHFTDCLTKGNGYYFEGKFYLICDPTYIGASIGRCMPKYRSSKPQVRPIGPDGGDYSISIHQLSGPKIDSHVLNPQLTLNSAPSLPL